MNRRAAGAALCAVAAIVLVVAAVVPWWRVADRDDATGARANVTLLGGEQCVGAQAVSCKSIALDGRPGARDDLFAWAGRTTLVLTLAAAGLAITLAFAGGRPRRALRATCATVALGTAASAATVVSIERLPTLYGTPALGGGLWLALVGAALLAAGAAWPLAEPDRRAPLRRWGLGAAVAALVLVAWATLALRGWWHGDAEFGQRSRSALGFEVCDLGTCARFGNGAAAVRSFLLLALVAACAAALLAAAAGLIARVVRGTAPHGWGITTAIAAGATLATTAAALALVPSRGTHLGVGAWVFLGATVGLGGVAIVAMRWMQVPEPSDDGPPPPLRFGAVPSGPKPVLAPLGAGAVTAPPPPGPTPSPPAIAAYAPALSPAPPHRPPTAPPPPLAPRPSPPCPTCRQATLWHGKREAWWCSTCKRAL
ncbi:MAG: hypothetical protein IPL61_38695 [Myxococcales bacterium]|nr:hypothetical protein [Myxococcales bacterium]